MTILSAQSATLAADGLPLDASDVRLTLDETRAPFADLTFTLPYTEAIAAAVDPRADVRVAGVLSQTFTGSDTLADISAEFGNPVTVAELTATWGALQPGTGITVSDITARYGHPWNAVTPAAQRRRFDLAVRSRDIDHDAGTIAVHCASDEALLIDYRQMNLALNGDGLPVPVQAAGTAVVDIVRGVLRQVVPGAILLGDPAFLAPPLDQDARTWAPGVSAWDFLLPLTASAGTRLWCDEMRVWRLLAPTEWDVPDTLTLQDTGTIVTATDSIDRDSNLWFDAVVVTYTWTDQAGERRVAWDIAGDPNASKVLPVAHDSAYPGPGEAAARLAKLQGQGRVVDTEAVSDFTAYPAQQLLIELPDTLLDGFVTSVTWRIPDDRMRVGGRELTEV